MALFTPDSKSIYSMCAFNILLHAKQFVEWVVASRLQLAGTIYDGHTFVPYQGSYSFQYVPD